jgi:hypothetical protein
MTWQGYLTGMTYVQLKYDDPSLRGGLDSLKG